jgi:hypothetical protein
MKKNTKTLLLIILLLTVISVAMTYHRTYVKGDYEIIVEDEELI